MTLAELLGVQPADDGALRFRLGRELHGAFGGAFGGAVAACALIAARRAAPGRVPVGLDVRFLRSLPAGDVEARAEIVREGRSLTVVAVDMDAPRHGVRATVSLCNPDALHPLDRESVPSPLRASYEEGGEWRQPAGVEIPIVSTLAPRILGRVGDGIATALRLPWTPDAGTAAEACCFAADLCVGPPVGAACVDAWVPHPNPDLSLRFAGQAPVGEVVTGIGKVARIVGGVALVDIEVQSEGDVVASGVATSLLLAGEGSNR
jgi:acyl-coenzyme A thioesterase PaaI-like protein